MPKDFEGSTGSAYKVDKENKRVLIPIDVLRKMRGDGIITNSEYQKLKKGKK